MRETARYDLRPHPADGGERRAVLLVDGDEAGTVPGAVLEAQYQAGPEALLFLSHDIPFEEQLDILLLDAAARPLERVSLYSAYATGSFRPLALTGPDALSFRFFGGPPWQVRILPRARWRRPFSDPHGVHRARRFSTRIEVRPLAAPSQEDET